MRSRFLVLWPFKFHACLSRMFICWGDFLNFQREVLCFFFLLYAGKLLSMEDFKILIRIPISESCKRMRGQTREIFRARSFGNRFQESFKGKRANMYNYFGILRSTLSSKY